MFYAGVHECPPLCSIVGSTLTVHQFFWILQFCHTCSLCHVELVVQFPTKGSTQVLLCLFILYSVGPHPVSSLHIYYFVVSRAIMAGAASGLTSGMQGYVNVHHGALLLMPQWQCIARHRLHRFSASDAAASAQCNFCASWFGIALALLKQCLICIQILVQSFLISIWRLQVSNRKQHKQAHQ